MRPWATQGHLTMLSIRIPCIHVHYIMHTYSFAFGAEVRLEEDVGRPMGTSVLIRRKENSCINK